MRIKDENIYFNMDSYIYLINTIQFYIFHYIFLILMLIITIIHIYG
jgi:hypothetical protein